MPGLSGKHSAFEPLVSKQALLKTFAAVHAIPGVTLVRGIHASSHCVITNDMTGILKEYLDQPAMDTTSQHALFIEGEIHNLHEIRSMFPGSTAVSPPCLVLRLLLEMGMAGIDRLDGCFNLAWYDQIARRLVLVSDRFASKPLYYLQERGVLIFGSEKKSVLAASSAGLPVDPLGILQVFAHGHNLAGRTFLEGLYCVRPGSWIEHFNGELTISNFRRLRFLPPLRLSAENLIEEGCRRLKRAAIRRLAGKDRILLSLSGGLDSRAVACAIPREIRPLWSRTRGFEHDGEYMIAAKVARRLGLSHYREEPSQVPLSKMIAGIVWRTEGASTFLNMLSAYHHAEMKEKGDFLLTGAFGDVLSGAHIYPFMFLPVKRGRFLEKVFSWYTVRMEGDISKVLRQDVLRMRWPDLRAAFIASFDDIDEPSNVSAYQIWDLRERQARMTVASTAVDSHLFESVRLFLDGDCPDFFLSLATPLRLGQTLYQAIVHRLGPELRDVPYYNTGLRLRGTVAGNALNYGVVQVDKVYSKVVSKFAQRTRSGHGRLGSEDIAQMTRNDPGFRQVIEDSLRVGDLDDSIFDKPGILNALNAHLEGREDNTRVLCLVATFAMAMRYFAGKRPAECPPEAVACLRML